MIQTFKVRCPKKAHEDPEVKLMTVEELLWMTTSPLPTVMEKKIHE